MCLYFIEKGTVFIKMRILLICTYFGALPEHFPFFLKSCEYNPDIDWLIYTDDTRFDYNIPQNVRIQYISFDEIKTKIQSMFDFEISLETPYKICDFRVAFGDIFEEDISLYDFWGYCDFDVIFGDICKYLSKDILMRYSKFFIFGCLSIYKNVPEINRAYKHDLVDVNRQIYLSYKDIFSSAESWHFDEVNGIFDIHSIFQDMKLPYYDTSEHIADIVMKSKRLYLLSDKSFIENRVVEWVNGKLYDRFVFNGQLGCREYSLFHFSGRSFAYDQKPSALTKAFLITSDSILTKYPQIDLCNISKYSKVSNNNEVEETLYVNPNITFKRIWRQYTRLRNKKSI